MPRGISPRTKFIGNYIKSKGLENSTREEQMNAFKEADLAYKAFGTRKPRGRASERARFIGAYIRSLNMKGSTREERNDAFREAAEAWRERRGVSARKHNPFLDTLVAGFGQGAGFTMGFQTAKSLLKGPFKNPIGVGELVTLKGNGAYNGKEAEILEHRPGNLLKPDMYKVRILDTGEKFILRGKAVARYGKNPIMGELVTIKKEGAYKGTQGKVIGTEGGFFSPKLRLLLPGGEQVVVPSGSVKSLNPMEVPWSKNHIVHADVSTLNNPSGTLTSIILNGGRSRRFPRLSSVAPSKYPTKDFAMDLVGISGEAREVLEYIIHNKITDMDHPGYGEYHYPPNARQNAKAILKELDKLTVKQPKFVNPDLEVPWEQNHIQATIPWHLNPLEVPWEHNHIKATMDWNLNPLEVPWEQNHIKATIPWSLNPARRRRKHLRCPIHGNYVHVRKGWRTVTCPVGGERLGIRK